MINSRRGSALLTVLWLTAALAAVGIAVASNVRSETERSAAHVDQTKAFFMARSAIERASLHMLWSRMHRTPDGVPLYLLPGQPVTNLSFPSAEVRVEIIPETSKLSVNASMPEEIARLLMALSMPEDRAIEMADAIVDWRTPLSPDHGSPFDPFYLSQRPSFLARHASFVENEEMLLVKGIDPDFYYGTSLPPGPARPGLRDCLSVLGTAGAVDVNTALSPVLQALGIAPADAAAIVDLRQRSPILDVQRLAAITQSLGPPGYRLRIGGNSIFTLRATARLREANGRLSDMRRTVSALVKFYLPGSRGGQNPNYEVLRWYDRN